ncbi:MAG: protein kinase, partial [Myxococcales bacterium]|nr:protein kinase [Myxococcales bacterium]
MSKAMPPSVEDTVSAKADTDDAAASASRRGKGPTVLRRGDHIGRYLILESVGQGAMGEVHAAHDPELDRKIALKLLLSDRREGPDARMRILREAQAMARLVHPNTVTVHDVGEHEGRVFVAMEFVEGQDLRAWLRGDHGWRAILDMFIQAGEGLAA